MSPDTQPELPYPTDKPWTPWLREGGLTDGDKILISMSTAMAEAILKYQAWFRADETDLCPAEGAECDILAMAETLVDCGAEL